MTQRRPPGTTTTCPSHAHSYTNLLRYLQASLPEGATPADFDVGDLETILLFWRARFFRLLRRSSSWDFAGPVAEFTRKHINNRKAKGTGAMSRTVERMPRSPFSGDPNYHGGHRHIPILPSSATSIAFSQPDAMDVTTPTSAMGPPMNSSPEMEHDSTNHAPSQSDISNITNGVSGGSLSAAAAASSQQPKVVQTAFIHKLYKYDYPSYCIKTFTKRRCSMLEDRSIQNLISWSNSNDSFVMSPSSDFSKVLA